MGDLRKPSSSLPLLKGPMEEVDEGTLKGGRSCTARMARRHLQEGTSAGADALSTPSQTWT